MERDNKPFVQQPQPASADPHQHAANPDPRANENLEQQDRQASSTKSGEQVNSEITDGEDA
jgi:hypothetical protein